MSKLTYMLVYYSYLDGIELLGDDEAGRLFKALLKYGADGDERKLVGNERFIYPLMKSQMDRDALKYEQKCEKNRESAKKRTQANANERIRPPCDGSQEKEKEE